MYVVKKERCACQHGVESPVITCMCNHNSDERNRCENLFKWWKQSLPWKLICNQQVCFNVFLFLLKYGIQIFLECVIYVILYTLAIIQYLRYSWVILGTVVN
jgi:hypothetical protein